MKLFDNKFCSLGLEDKLCRALYELGGRRQAGETLELVDINQSVVILVQNIHRLRPLKALH